MGIILNDKCSAEPFRWHYRLLLVIPAFLIGFIVPGVLIRSLTELGSLAFSNSFLIDNFARINQAIVDGSCAVWFARMVVSQGKHTIAKIATYMVVISISLVLIGSYLLNYYRGVPADVVTWEVTLILITAASSVLTLTYGQRLYTVFTGTRLFDVGRSIWGFAFGCLGIILLGLTGLVSILVGLSVVYQAVGTSWGFYGMAIAFIFLPLTVIVAPWFALLEWGNPFPVAITYGGFLLSGIVILIGHWINKDRMSDT